MRDGRLGVRLLAILEDEFRVGVLEEYVWGERLDELRVGVLDVRLREEREDWLRFWEVTVDDLFVRVEDDNRDPDLLGACLF